MGVHLYFCIILTRIPCLFVYQYILIRLKAKGIPKLFGLLGPNTEFNVVFVLPPSRAGSFKIPVNVDGELPTGVNLYQYVAAYDLTIADNHRNL